VATVTASDVWAVGACFNGNAPQTLTEQWNGTAWKEVPTPDPGGVDDRSQLNAAAATSADDVWAVGYYVDNDGNAHTVALHWNGTAWSRVATPNPGNDSELSGVAATSADNAWAVGDTYNGTAQQTVVLHWNGTKWTRTASPDPGGTAYNNTLNAVAATSASNAWAVGDYITSAGASQTLTQHWNGTTWSTVTSPSPGSNTNDLTGVAATSAGAWAVGYVNGPSTESLILSWNGTAWTQQTAPSPAGAISPGLTGITATSATNAWAVGSYLVSGVDSDPELTLVLHWNGTAWSVVSSPSPGATGSQNVLSAVGALSASHAWAVGYYDSAYATPSQTLTERWNGTAWTHVTSP
jgi:hypothetical protein